MGKEQQVNASSQNGTTDLRNSMEKQDKGCDCCKTLHAPMLKYVFGDEMFNQLTMTRKLRTHMIRKSLAMMARKPCVPKDNLDDQVEQKSRKRIVQDASV